MSEQPQGEWMREFNFKVTEAQSDTITGAEKRAARIITMQQTAILIFPPESMSSEMIDQYNAAFPQWNADQQARAEAELSQAFADGYEIADVTQTVGERVIVTTWTLRTAVKVTIEPFKLDFNADLFGQGTVEQIMNEGRIG